MVTKRYLLKRHPLTKELLNDARNKRDAGEECQFAIEDPRGLSLRIRGGEVAYYVQARTRVRGAKSMVVKRRLGTVDSFKFEKIKALATDVIYAIKHGQDPDAVIEARAKGGDEKSVAIAVDRADAMKGDLWTWETLITEYTRRTRKGSKDANGNEIPKLRPSSILEIEARLRDRPENAELKKRYVKELRLEDLENVRDLIEASGAGPSAVAKFVDLAKRILHWGLTKKRRFTGLDQTATWWEVLSHEYEMGDRSGRFLTPPQIGMLLALLEGVRHLKDNSNDAVLGALQVSWMIPQRASALVNMRALGSDRWVEDPAPERRGWRVYTWTANDVKGKRVAKLSIPPIAIEILERVALYSHQKLEAVSGWAFPQDRNKYFVRTYARTNRNNAIPPHLDKAITPSSLNHALDALAGLKNGWDDLLTIVGLPTKIGPHDLRRSVTTFFENSGEGAYASALLDHRITGADKMSREIAAVTQSVYSAADRVVFKAEGMLIWMNAVLPAYEAAKRDPRLAKAVEMRKLALATSKALKTKEPARQQFEGAPALA
jgi:integrase